MFIAKIVQFNKREKNQSFNNQNLLSIVLDRRSKRNGINYEKLYFGTDTERKIEKQKQLELRKAETEVDWYSRNGDC